jgi:hypothetical protein
VPAALAASSGIARAQAYPSRPVYVIVGTLAGSSPDIIARLMGQWLAARLRQQFIIENRPGAGGNIGTEAVVRAPQDGHALLLVTTANTISTTFYDNVRFHSLIARAHQGQRAPPARGSHRNAFGRAAGAPDRGRGRAGLRAQKRYPILVVTSV